MGPVESFRQNASLAILAKPGQEGGKISKKRMNDDYHANDNQ